MCLMLGMLLVGCDGGNNTQQTVTEKNGGDESSAQMTETDTEETEAPVVNPKFELNVMSFNVLGTSGVLDRSYVVNKTSGNVDARVETRGPKLLKLLEGEEIDVAGFQELRPVWRNWLQDNLPKKYAVAGGTTVESEEGGWIIYRKDKYALVDSGVFWLVDGAPTTSQKIEGSNFDRMCSWVVLQDAVTLKLFMVMDTHLDTVSDEIRAAQAKVIVDKADVLREEIETKYRTSNCPVIIMGDMNSRPDSSAYKVLTSSMRDSCEYAKELLVSKTYSSSPGFNEVGEGGNYIEDGHRIDYIIVTRNIEVMTYNMIHASTDICEYGSYISDHNAIVTRLKI